MNVEPRPLGRCQMLHLVQVLNTINPPFFSEGKPSLPGFISSGEDHPPCRGRLPGGTQQCRVKNAQRWLDHLRIIGECILMANSHGRCDDRFRCGFLLHRSRSSAHRYINSPRLQHGPCEVWYVCIALVVARLWRRRVGCTCRRRRRVTNIRSV